MTNYCSPRYARNEVALSKVPADTMELATREPKELRTKNLTGYSPPMVKERSQKTIN